MKLALAALLFASPVAVSAESYYDASTGRIWDSQRPHTWTDYSQRPAPHRGPDSSQGGHSVDRTCFREEYREEYTPGTADQPGFIRSWHEQVEVPCKNDSGYTRRTTIEYDNNDCTDGKIAGGILGGAAGAALSRGDGRWWAIPLGGVTGATIGCDIDGG